MDEITLTVRTFYMGTPKMAALKPLEEAAETYAAYQAVQCGAHMEELADEIADTIQACVNLAVRYDIDLETAMMRCEGRNRARGRYEEGE